MKFRFESLKLHPYLIVVFLLLSLAVSITGFFAYHKYSKAMRSINQQQLAAVAYLKVQQIISWRKERTVDALSIQNPIISRSIHQFLENPSIGNRQEILALVESIYSAYDYENIMLFDAQDKLRMSANNKGLHVERPYAVSAAQMIAAPQIYFSDLHKAEDSAHVEQDIFVPIMIPKGLETVLVGYVQLLMYAEDFLFPLLQTWPTPSPSAETLLIRREGNQVVFLNPLHHIKDTALIMRRPVAEATLPAAMAAGGKTGIVEGLDYRGVPVLAALRHVPGFNWFLIAKIDMAEVYAPIRRLALIIALISVVLVVLTATSIALFWNIQQSGLYRRQLQLEKEYQTILETAIDGFWIVNSSDGAFIEVNDAYCEMSGYTRDELLKMHVPDIEAIESPEDVKRQITKALSDGQGRFETRQRRKDGSLMDVEVSIKYDNIRGGVFVVFVRDITASRQAQEEIRKLSKAVEQSPVTVVITDREGAIEYVNERFVTETGYEKEEVMGRNPRILQSGKLDPLFYKDLWDTILAGHIWKGEFQNKNKKGALYWESASISPILGEEGKITHFVALKEDVTERRQIEEELHKLYRAVEESNVMIFITDRDGTIEYVNPCFTTVSGYTREEALGKNAKILMSDYHAKEFFKDLWDTILGGSVWRGEFCNRQKDGKIIWQDASIAPVRCAVGEITHFVAIQEDITEKKQILEDLSMARDLAEAATRAKSEFLANMSHELRTPLNAVIGFSEVLKEQYFGPLNEKQAEYVTDILESGRHLLNLINDILDLAKVEAGKMELELSLLIISDLLQSSLVMIKEKALRHAIHLTMDIADELQQLELRADERKTKQILFNLLSNALKFTPDGGSVRLSARIVDCRLSIDDLKKSESSTEKQSSIIKHQSSIEISVADSGIGIAPEHQEKIFEAFYQVQNQATDKSAGTGLGLPLTRRLAELQGGRIWLQSTQSGMGSTFSFTLPLRPVVAEDETAPAGLPGQPSMGRNGRPVLPVLAAEKEILDYLRKTITLSKSQNMVVTLCGFHATDIPVQRAQLTEVIEKAKRADDVMGLLEGGQVCLLLHGIGREQARTICERIMSQFKNRVEGLDISYTLAAFPEDGQLPEVLVEKVKTEGQG